MSNVFVSSHPLIRHKLTKMRCTDTNPKKFRELVREIAALLAYESTADLAVTPVDVQTPLAIAHGWELQHKIGLVPILRAGLGMVEGIWELMPSAEVWHIGLYRDEKTLKPVQYYNKLPVRTNGIRMPDPGPHAGYRRLRDGDRGCAQELGG